MSWRFLANICPVIRLRRHKDLSITVPCNLCTIGGGEVRKRHFNPNIHIRRKGFSISDPKGWETWAILNSQDAILTGKMCERLEPQGFELALRAFMWASGAEWNFFEPRTHKSMSGEDFSDFSLLFFFNVSFVYSRSFRELALLNPYKMAGDV